MASIEATEGYVITYIDIKTDEEHLLFLDTKEQAEHEFSLIKGNKQYVSYFLMTREEYDQFELDVMELDDGY